MMARKFFVAAVIVVSLIAIFLSGSSILAGKQYEIAFIVKSLTNPFWIDMKAGAESAAKDLNVKLQTMAPVKADNVEEQIRMIEDLIQRKIDAIVLAPADTKGIIPGIEKANQAGVPVVIVNTKAAGGKIVSFVGAENFDAATMIAERVVEKLNGKGKVVILEGVPAAQTAIDRKNGFLSVLKKYSGIEILASQTANFQRAEGMMVMENLLQRFPHIDAVLCANDEMALGALEAIDAAGRLKEMIVTGFDANRDAVVAVRDGRLFLTCDQNSAAQGSEGVRAAVRYLNGESVPARIVTKVILVDKTNVDSYLKKYGIK
ncbi:MAG TPA: substrate-binding domain-containing protein [Firmicutes bacterium]|nr:substrate-binding domain-containing protein [Bacillota bacterium]